MKIVAPFAVLMALLVSTLLVGQQHQPNVRVTQTEGLFARDAKPVGFGAASMSHDGKITVSVAEVEADEKFPGVLKVSVDGHTFRYTFEFALNAQILWAPAAHRFALTGSEGGAVGQYRTAVVTVTDGGLAWLDITEGVERAFGQPVKRGWPETPNVGAATWRSNDQLIVVAQILGHSNCDSFGTFAAYQIAAATGHVGRRYDQIEAKRRWRNRLGIEPLNASDECVRRPSSCYVATNHPELGRD